MTEVYSNKREESPVKVRQYLKADVWSREGLGPQGDELVDWATGVGVMTSAVFFSSSGRVPPSLELSYTL